MKINFDIEKYNNHEAWSTFLAEDYGVKIAASFAIGSDMLLDDINEGLNGLSLMPIGSHLGQIGDLRLRSELPPQFLMRYDYDFLYLLKSQVLSYRKIAKYGSEISASSVLDELVLYLIMEYSVDLLEEMVFPGKVAENRYDDFDEWAFDVIGDMDIETCLYSDLYLNRDHKYHFDNWEQRY